MFLVVRVWTVPSYCDTEDGIRLRYNYNSYYAYAAVPYSITLHLMTFSKP